MVCLVLWFECFGVYLVCVYGVYLVCVYGGYGVWCLGCLWFVCGCGGMGLFRMRLCLRWLCCVYCCGLLGKDLTVSYFNSVAMDLCWFWCLFGVALIIR